MFTREASLILFCREMFSYKTWNKQNDAVLPPTPCSERGASCVLLQLLNYLLTLLNLNRIKAFKIATFHVALRSNAMLRECYGVDAYIMVEIVVVPSQTNGKQS